MSAHIPVRVPDPLAVWPDDFCCDACCAVDRNLVDCDGDRLCGPCADKWEADLEAERLADEIPELQRQMRNASVYRGAQIEQQIYDRTLLRALRMPEDEFDRSVQGHRKWNGEFR